MRKRIRILDVATGLFRLAVFAQNVPFNPLVSISLWRPLYNGRTGKAIWWIKLLKVEPMPIILAP